MTTRTKRTSREKTDADRVKVHQRRKFLDALVVTGTVTAACKQAGIGRTAVYEWRDADAEFKAAWEDAIIAWVDSLETEAYERAIAGSDVLLIFLLKGNRPEKYKETVRNLHGQDPDSAPTESRMVVVIGGNADDPHRDAGRSRAITGDDPESGEVCDPPGPGGAAT